MVKLLLFFPPLNTWQMMIFLNPLDALIPKIPFSFFAKLWGQVTSRARESVSVGFPGGGGELSPLGGIDPPPPR